MRMGANSTPQSSRSGLGRSRDCVSTVPTEPGAVFDAGMGGSYPYPPDGEAVVEFPTSGSNCRLSGKGAFTMAMATVNNGVNVQALLDAREVLKGAPEAAKFTWRASCKWENGTHSMTNVKGFFGLGQEQTHKTETSFSADHPEIFASEDRGITPIEYVLVGLASCLTAGVAAVAQNRGVQLRSVESQLEGKMDIRGILGMDSDVRNGYDDIKVTFKIDADADRKEIEAIVAQSQKRSAVYDVISNPVNVTVEVV